MSLYSRAEVAAELEKSKDILAALRCEPEASHAINILFSHVEHLSESVHDARTLAQAFLRQR